MRFLVLILPILIPAAGWCFGDLADVADAAQRRYTLWQTFETDREAAFEWMEKHLDEPAPRVGVLMVELARQMPQERRGRFFAAFAVAQTNSVVRKEISRATEFPFRRDNLPVSQNPANDHPISTVKSIPLPLDGWRFRHDKEGDGHLGRAAYFSVACKPTSCWPEVKIGCFWEDNPGVGRNYDGIGWYRLEWTLPPKPEGANVFELVFGAVDEEAWVWVNGEYVGQHVEGVSGWNKPFRLDVAKELRWGETNIIVIRVNDTENGGGIWKPVTLEALKCDF